MKAYVALGSNLGEPAERLDAARRALAETAGVELLRVSSYHSTAAVGGPAGQPDFLNAVAELETELAPEELLAYLQEIERAQGRDRSVEPHHGPRRLDLDLLMQGEERLETTELSLPHPRMEDRLFVLEPLAELTPQLVLPGCGESVELRVRKLQSSGRIEQFSTVREAREWCRTQRAAGRTIGFVATMGALHVGHLTLVQRALDENDVACVSIFVNPLQFGETNDLDNYPRDFDGDAELLDGIGTSMVFTGTLEQFFEGELDAEGGLPAERLLAPGPWAVGLEGEFRVGHFEGVATIVDKLFEVVEPTRAYFGQKDYQQARVVGDLPRRDGLPEVVICETSREASGLARSSRNTRLDSEQLERAGCLSRALFAAARLWQAGEREAAALSAELRRHLNVPGVEVEYAALRSTHEWSDSEPQGALDSAVALVAARIGLVRLIDIFVLSEPVPSSVAETLAESLANEAREA